MTGSASGRSGGSCCEADCGEGVRGRGRGVDVYAPPGSVHSQFLFVIDAKIGTLFGVPFRTPQKERPEYAREEYSSALASGRYFSPLSKPIFGPQLHHLSFSRPRICTFIHHCLQCVFILPP